MDYEKKYKESMAKMSTFLAKHDGFTISKDGEMYKELSEIFPELAESEDEMIQKVLVGFFKSYKEQGTCGAETFNGLPTDNILAWLEKQGEKKPYGQREECSNCQMNYAGQCKGSCAMKRGEQKPIIEMKSAEESLGIDSETYSKIVDECIYGEQKPADKVEPKFKVGDFIVNDYCMGKVIELTSDAYLLDTGQGIPFSHEHNAHLWTIQDAKDGDVLHSTGFHNDCIFIFNGIDKWRFDEPKGERAVATGHCCLTLSADNMEFGIQGPDCIEVDTVKPATKIQRDLLFQKMHEAGYEWDADKKELKKTGGLICYCRTSDEDVEYTRTDAFINNACEWLECNLSDRTDIEFWIEDFVTFMKGE